MPQQGEDEEGVCKVSSQDKVHQGMLSGPLGPVGRFGSSSGRGGSCGCHAALHERIVESTVEPGVAVAGRQMLEEIADVDKHIRGL